jgi:hypothetical protein
MSDQALQLEYGKSGGLSRRRWVRWTIVIVTLAALVLGAHQLNLYPRAVFLYHQRQCLNDELPAATVAWDETATAAATLQAGAPHVRALVDPRNGMLRATYRRASCLIDMQQSLQGESTAYFPPAPVFLHRRDGGNGDRLVQIAIQRVVRLQLLLGSSPSYQAFLTCVVATPAGWSSNLTAVSGEWLCPELSTPAEVGKLRLYAGQVDPADASHFTIECDTALGRRVIDGWLQKDDTVKFQLRPLPATQPTP